MKTYSYFGVLQSRALPLLTILHFSGHTAAQDQVFDKWVVVSSPTPVMIENKYAIATKITTVDDGSVVVQVRV